MKVLKKVWLTQCESDLFKLTLQSERVKHDYHRIRVKESLFPSVPTKENPLKHTVQIGLLDSEALLDMADAIYAYFNVEAEAKALAREVTEEENV